MNVTRHNGIYTFLLAIYDLICLTGGLYLLYHGEPSRDRNTIVLIAIFLFVMTLCVLILRLRKSKYARIATLIANIVYLPLLFLGAALGIYGLLIEFIAWKADREDSRLNKGRASA